jgi:chorismate mutase
MGNQINEVLIHCESSINRGVAMMKNIAEIMENDDKDIFIEEVCNQVNAEICDLNVDLLEEDQILDAMYECHGDMGDEVENAFLEITGIEPTLADLDSLRAFVKEIYGDVIARMGK